MPSSPLQLGPLIIHPIFFFFHNQIFGLIFSLIGERMVPYETSEMQRCVRAPVSAAERVLLLARAPAAAAHVISLTREGLPASPPIAASLSPLSRSTSSSASTRQSRASRPATAGDTLLHGRS
jgi:hypothetical protein